jgi:hypothetical protein
VKEVDGWDGMKRTAVAAFRIHHIGLPHTDPSVDSDRVCETIKNFIV